MKPDTLPAFSDDVSRGGRDVDPARDPFGARWAPALVVFLRVTSVVTLLALVAVVVPRAWMSAAHGWLGMGPIPDAPIVQYLARSLSALYALCGGLLWFYSTDLRRYGPAIRLFAWLGVPGGIALFGIDLSAGMPTYWTACEGPFVVAFSVVLHWLCRRAGI